MALHHLFTPIRVGSLEVKNRVVLAPLDVGLHGPNGEVTDRYIDFLVDRARGETGLLITEFTSVWPEKRVITTSVWDDRFIPGLSRISEAVHAAGAPVFMQIAALGGKSYVEPFAPSAVESELYEQVPREMTVPEIEQMVECFVRGAERAQKAGFDGVEYHCAHSYLGGQFISPHTNRRDDEYGGDFQRRMKFSTDVIAGIRRACGDGFPIGFKFSAHEHLHGGVNHRYDVGETDGEHLRVAKYMEDIGVVYLHVATTSSTIMKVKGFVECTHPSVPPLYIKPNTLVDLAAEVKNSGVRVPVIATGGITDPVDAEQIIAEGHADMVALGRTLIADGHWARKARLGENIAPCIRCNFCHTFVVMDRGGIQCTTNPVVGRENIVSFEKTARSRRVVVVGAGPAGLEAGLRAREMGHDAVVFDRRDTLGGEMISASIPEFKWDIKRLLKYYEVEVERTGLEVRLGAEVTVDTLKEEGADAVVLATGGEAIVPDVPGIDDDCVVTAIDALVRWEELDIGERVMVLGAGLVGYEMAWHAAAQGRAVTMVSRRSENEVGNLEEHGTNLALLIKGTREAGVRVLADSELEAVEEGTAILKDADGREHAHPVDKLIVSRGYRPRQELKRAIEKAGPGCEVLMAGDCVEVRNFFDAINEGAHVVRRSLA